MAEDRLERLLNLQNEQPDDSFLSFAIAQEFTKKGQFDEALRRYESLLKNDPQYVATYYHLGKLYETLDSIKKAIETYEIGKTIARQTGAHHDLKELQAALDLVLEA